MVVTEHFDNFTMEVAMLPIKRFSSDLPLKPITIWLTPSLSEYSIIARSGVNFVS